MAYVLITLVNAWRFLCNVFARLFKRPPDYVWIEVSGSLPEFELPTSFLRRRLSPGAPSISLEALRERLDRISSDGRAKGIALRIRNLDADWTVLEEVRSELARFRQRGGRSIAYLLEPDTRSYYLACAADEVYATPLSTINVTGIRARVNFLKDALNHVGVEAEVVAVSPYKSAGDTFVRNDFSKESREQTERLLERRYATLVDAVASGRDLSPEEVREKIDLAPYTASSAVTEGLIDGVCYEDELPGKLGANSEQAKLAEWDAARGALRMPYRKRAQRVVGMVRLSGAIVRGKSRKLPVPLPLLGGEQAGDESVVAALRVAEKDRRVAAILFHVDSRGGDALASDLIWREVQRIREKKPVVVLMGAAAASGGYYVSAAAHYIVARENTVTGSIGVILIRPTTASLFGKLGVNPVTVERGARSGILDTSHKPDADELGVLKGQIQHIYSEFKDRVSRGREIDLDALDSISGGRVWTGSEARERGLVDEIGGYRVALRKALDLGGIEEETPETLVKISPPRNARPAPGNPVEAAHDAVEVMKVAVSELRTPNIWAVSAYDISDGSGG